MIPGQGEAQSSQMIPGEGEAQSSQMIPCQRFPQKAKKVCMFDELRAPKK
jgi:hypothetical protein